MTAGRRASFVKPLQPSTQRNMSAYEKRPIFNIFVSTMVIGLRFLLILSLSRVDQFGTCFSPSPRGPRIRQTSAMVATTKPRKSSLNKKMRSKFREPSVGLAEFDSWAPDESAPQSPIPPMPSPLFASLAQSQLELLAHSLTISEPSPSTNAKRASTSKIKSMALYLPQENKKTGQLEFLPAVLYPPPSSDRVFIASEADSGVAPSLPKILTKLPGFAHATSLIPGYPMVSSSNNAETAGVGEAEEVMCDPITKNTALSVPLFSGSQTVGVLLVWPSVHAKRDGASVWTDADRKQVSLAAQSLSMALSMDTERSALKEQTDYFRESLSNSLHQVKNPLQALRTYGKLLQQQIANEGQTPQLLNLAQQLSVQSDRVVDLLLPMDNLADGRLPFMLNPSEPPQHLALTKWHGDNETTTTSTTSSGGIPWANQTEEFAREYNIQYDNDKLDSSTTLEMSSLPPPSRRRRSLQQQEEERSLEMEMSFLPDILEPILSGFQAIASETNIDFSVTQEELPGVTVSPTCLQEAVSNVIDNAFKYAVLPKPDSGFTRNPSPRVTVRMIANQQPLEPGATILVQDNGPGIPSNEVDQVFERGFRSESTSVVEGSGIGLDISRSLISKMGGTIQIVSSQDDPTSLGGATVKLVLFRNPTIEY